VLDEIARINAERDAEIEQALAWYCTTHLLRARKEEEAIKAGKKADDFEEKLDSAHTTYHIRRSRPSVGWCIYKVQYTPGERFKKIVQVVDMAIDGINAEAVAQALEIMRSGVEMHMLLQGGNARRSTPLFYYQYSIRHSKCRMQVLREKLADVLTTLIHEMG